MQHKSVNTKHYTIIACTSGEHHNCSPEGCCFPEGIIVLVFRNATRVFLSCVFINLIFVFLTFGQDYNSGMQKRIHFRTDMEHYICRPVNNSDVYLGYQFCKNITFILYIIYNARYNKHICLFHFY